MQNQNGQASKWLTKEPNMSDFMEMTINRVGDTATVIFDHIDGRPVRLLGFAVDSSLPDFNIREQAFYHYQDLRERLSR